MKIKNLLRQMQVFNLEHPTFLNAPGEHGVGKPDSLTFLAREEKEVHADTARCAEVASALKRKTLRIVG